MQKKLEPRKKIQPGIPRRSALRVTKFLVQQAIIDLEGTSHLNLNVVRGKLFALRELSLEMSWSGLVYKCDQALDLDGENLKRQDITLRRNTDVAKEG